MHREPDPKDEYFDVLDEQGNPTGMVKRRADVHRDGDWHRAFHCWVALEHSCGEPAILFQRRSGRKDTHPEQLDVAVGGHYRAGEGFDDVVREIEEELGFSPSNDSLIQVGYRRGEGFGPTWIDREIEDVYVHVLTQALESLQPAHEEISALDLLLLADIEDLFLNRRNQVPTVRYRVQPDSTLSAGFKATVTRDDFIPVPDQYWLFGSRAASDVLSGRRDVQLDLW